MFQIKRIKMAACEVHPTRLLLEAASHISLFPLPVSKDKGYINGLCSGDLKELFCCHRPA
jgi:hypothetical protein